MRVRGVQVYPLSRLVLSGLPLDKSDKSDRVGLLSRLVLSGLPPPRCAAKC